MATQMLDRRDLDLTASRRTLVLVWQNPVSRRLVKVGQLDALPDAHFAFQYLSSAWDDPSFVPLIEYPDRGAAYVSDEVPAFFANRILSADRPSYGRYLNWLGVAELGPEDIPFEVLARTGGGRATDTFHVVDQPRDVGGRFQSRFFVSGVQYSANSDQVVASLSDGAPLTLLLEQSNVVNPKAVLVDTAAGEKVGYVPDWLCADIHDRIDSGWHIDAVAERINPEAPAHVRVLCRVEARLG